MCSEQILQANELAATYYTWKDTDKGTDADGIFSNAGKLCALEAAITEIGLARVNPHSDVVRWKLKQQQ